MLFGAMSLNEAEEPASNGRYGGTPLLLQLHGVEDSIERDNTRQTVADFLNHENSI